MLRPHEQERYIINRKLIESLHCASRVNSEILDNPSKTGRVNSVMLGYFTVDPKISLLTPKISLLTLPGLLGSTV